MRYIIVSREVPARYGVLSGVPDRVGTREPGNGAEFPLYVATVILGPLFARLFGGSGPSRDEIELALARAHELGFEKGALWARARGDEPKEVLRTYYIDDEQLDDALPFERRCLTVGSRAGRTGLVPFDAPVLVGSFPGKQHYNAILSADGGASRIHVFNRTVAQACFTRLGGGILEDGCYLLHPKRENVLVPFTTFHSEMLREMTREAHVAMGRLGAKQLTVETLEGVSFGGKVISRIPGKAGSAAAEYQKDNERRIVFRWGSSTYDPEAALGDCVWLQDNAALMTIVDQRRRSNLTHYDEFSQVNTSFNVSLDVMRAFQAGFEWSSQSTYRYTVEFFDRPT